MTHADISKTTWHVKLLTLGLKFDVMANYEIYMDSNVAKILRDTQEMKSEESLNQQNRAIVLGL
jgi:hypothetical protein